MIRLITKEKKCPSIRFFDMISQSLNLNISFLNKLVIWIFEIFAIMQETTIFHPNDTGKFPKLFFRDRGGDLNDDEIDYNRKICYTIRFFDVIPQNLNLRLFATHKLLKRPLPSKRHRKISYFFVLDETLMMRLITKQNKKNKQTNKLNKTKHKT